MKKIDQKIVGWDLIQEQDVDPVEEDPSTPVKLKKRPAELDGSTVKLRSMAYEKPFFVTINFLDGKIREIFINTKNVEAMAWISALTTAWSAVFQKVDDYQFLIDEMISTPDPKGGHWAYGRFHASIVAEIGYIINCKIKGVELTKAEKPNEEPASKPSGSQCPECKAFAFVKKEGCDVCQECGYSKCS